MNEIMGFAPLTPTDPQYQSKVLLDLNEKIRATGIVFNHNQVCSHLLSLALP